MYESNNKNVSHPSHYMSDAGIEALDVIKAFTNGLEGYDAYATGTVIKYMLRWNKKNGLEDLEKALFYLTDLVERKKNDISKRVAQSIGKVH